MVAALEDPTDAEGKAVEAEDQLGEVTEVLYLQSDLSHEDAAQQLFDMQLASEAFHGFSRDAMEQLARYMTSLQFSFGEQICESGEPVSWCGLIVSGKLEAAIGARDRVTLSPGTFIGESSVWETGQTRAATVFGASDGLLMVITSEGLEALMIDCPELGLKLVKLLARAVFQHRQMDARYTRGTRLKPAMNWKATPRGKVARASGARTDQTATEDAKVAMFDLLKKNGMSNADAMMLCDVAMYHYFNTGDVLVQALCPCTHVLVIVEGEVLVESLQLKLSRNCALHAVEYFSDIVGAPITSIGRTLATSQGLLAGIPMKLFSQLFTQRPALAFSALRMLGAFGVTCLEAIQTEDGTADVAPEATQQSGLGAQTPEAGALEVFYAQRLSKQVRSGLAAKVTEATLLGGEETPVERFEQVTEMSWDESHAAMMQLQTISQNFRGFSSSELSTILEYMSTMRFVDGEHIIVKGEIGTWFGLLLKGRLAVSAAHGRAVLPAGIVIGERAVFCRNSKRDMDVFGASAGVMATMLVHGLKQLVGKHQRLGIKLMSLLARTAFDKCLEDCRYFRNPRLPTAIEWKPNFDYGAHDGTQLLVRLLAKHGLAEHHALEVSKIAQYYEFRKDDVLVQPLCPCSHLLFVLSGSVLLEEVQTEIADEGVLHVPEWIALGAPATSLTHIVASSQKGLLAGIKMESLNTMLSMRGALAHELCLSIGRLGLAINRAWCQSERGLVQVDVNPDLAPPSPAAKKKRGQARLTHTNALAVSGSSTVDSFVQKHTKRAGSSVDRLTRGNLQRLDQAEGEGASTDSDQESVSKRTLDRRSSSISRRSLERGASSLSKRSDKSSSTRKSATASGRKAPTSRTLQPAKAKSRGRVTLVKPSTIDAEVEEALNAIITIVEQTSLASRHTVTSTGGFPRLGAKPISSTSYRQKLEVEMSHMEHELRSLRSLNSTLQIQLQDAHSAKEAQEQLAQQLSAVQLQLKGHEEKVLQLEKEKNKIADELRETTEKSSKLVTSDSQSTLLSAAKNSPRLRVVFDPEKAQKKQVSIKEHPKVVLVLHTWWVTALATRTADTPQPDPNATHLERSQFFAIVRKIYKALNRTWDEGAAQETAIDEWGKSLHGAARMKRPAFNDYLCKTADTIAFLDDPSVHALFLWDLFRHIAHGNPPDRYVWKPDMWIQFAGYLMGEYNKDVLAHLSTPGRNLPNGSPLNAHHDSVQSAQRSLPSSHGHSSARGATPNANGLPAISSGSSSARRPMTSDPRFRAWARKVTEPNSCPNATIGCNRQFLSNTQFQRLSPRAQSLMAAAGTHMPTATQLRRRTRGVVMLPDSPLGAPRW